jgi:hypothetical protein
MSSEKRYSIVKEQGAYAHKTTAKRFSSTFTYRAILPDPDMSGLNKQAILPTFNIQYSIVFLIVKNDKIENLKGVPLQSPFMEVMFRLYF